MLDRTLLTHGIIAIVAVSLAVVAWTSPEVDASADKPTVVPGGDLTRVEWHERDKDDNVITVVLEKESKEAIAVRVEKVLKETGEPTIEEFPGTERAEDIFENLSPLRGDRALGRVDDEKREQLGLTAGNRLKLSFGKREVELGVGNETFGAGSYYVSAPSGEVYLLSSRTLSGLRNGGGSLLDRRAVGVDAEDVNRLVLTSGEESREFVQRYPEDRAKAFYADAAEPDAKIVQATSWANSLLAVRVGEFVDEPPAGGPIAKAEFFDQAKRVALVELWGEQDGEFYLRSSRFSRVAKLSRSNASRLTLQLDAVLKAEP